MLRIVQPLIACLLYGLWAIHPAHAADYFVSPSGNDANSGLAQSAPWRTILKVNATTLRAGDRVLFQGGQDFPVTGGTSLYLRHSGTAASRIVITSYGTGKARLVVGNGSKTGIDASVCNYVMISNLIVAGPGVTAQTVAGDGLNLLWFNDSLIDQVEVFGFRGSGIKLNGCHRTTVSGAYAHDNGFAGIYSEGTSKNDVNNCSNLIIRGCRANDNPGDSEKIDLHSGNGILLTMSVDCLIERCEAARNGANMGYTNGGPVGIWTASSSRITIQNCISHENRSPITWDGGGFDLDQNTTDCIVQYNYSYKNHGAGYLQYTNPNTSNSGNTFRYNISENDGMGNGSAGIAVIGQTSSSNSNTHIYNNVVFNSGGRNCITGSANSVLPSSIYVRNNIFIMEGTGRFVDFMAQAVVQGNLYWNYTPQSTGNWAGYTSLAAWRQASGKERLNGVDTGIFADPKLTRMIDGQQPTDPAQLLAMNAYRTSAISPAINAGINLRGAFAVDPGPTDFFGTQLATVNAFDIGAFEYQSVAPQNVAPQIQSTSARFPSVTLP
jgi:parallel beta-helix repeat protein